MGSIVVKVKPGARAAGVSCTPGGVEIRVAAPAIDGRATEAARRALAEALGVPQRTVSLTRGARSRDKAFEVDGLTREEMLARLADGRR